MTTKNKPRQTRASTQSTSSGMFSVLLSFFIGYAVAHVFDINFIGGQLEHVVSNGKSKQIQQATAQNKPTLPKPKFEYYSLLKKEGAENKQNHSQDQNQSAIQVTEANPLEPINQDNHQYVLQLASYYKKADAERMKAELILQGHLANIHEYKTENRIIYRLMIGPFKRKTEAEKEQVDLARQLHVMGMIRRTQLT